MNSGNLTVLCAEGFTGMTLMQELSHSLSTLPYQGYSCLVHRDKSAEAKSIQNMGKFNVNQVPYGNCDEIVKHLQNVQMAIVIPPASKNKLQHTQCFLEALQKAEVKNVLLLSSLGADATQEKAHLKEFFQIESMAKEMNFNLCIVRAGFYAHNLLLYKKQMVADKVLPGPTEDGKFAPIDLADVGECLVQIVKEPTKHYEKDSFTGDEMAQVATEELGHKIQFKSISMNEAEQLLKSNTAIDEAEALYLLEYYSLAKDNVFNLVSYDFETVMGRKPTSLREFFQKYQTEFGSTGKRED